jgi:hypothetical protein
MIMAAISQESFPAAREQVVGAANGVVVGTLPDSGPRAYLGRSRAGVTK